MQESPDLTTEKLYQSELKHLHKRIQNNRAAMSLSAVALANPVSYQTNVLAACQNTVQEWRSIRKHYSNTTTHTATQTATATDEMSISRMDEQTVRATGQAIFELVQQSLQCGPLAGAQPGYFKRCGTNTAQLVQNYLDTIVLTNMDENGMDHNHHHDAVTVLGFTAKQAAAIVTWQRNAQKAAVKSDQPPSRSVLARRDKAVSNTNKKCKK